MHIRSLTQDSDMAHSSCYFSSCYAPIPSPPHSFTLSGPVRRGCSPPSGSPRKLGFPLLLDGSKLGIPYSSNMVVVRKSYLDRNRETVRNFIKAVIEGIHYYKANKEFSLKVISKYMRITDREVAEENFREYDFPLRPYPAREYFELPIQEVGRKEPRVLKENPERFVDSSLVKDLDETGFIEKLSREYGLK